MSERIRVSLEEAAALAGARQRLDHAKQALEDFTLQQISDGVLDCAPEEFDSLERQHPALLVELDTAERQYRKSLEEWQAQQARADA